VICSWRHRWPAWIRHLFRIHPHIGNEEDGMPQRRVVTEEADGRSRFTSDDETARVTLIENALWFDQLWATSADVPLGHVPDDTTLFAAPRAMLWTIWSIPPDEVVRQLSAGITQAPQGWGQDGPYAQAPGHDINYIALAGVLAHLGRAGGPPAPPLNLLGDYGGGGMLLAVGILAALVETARSGQGQVIDAAMVDGSALLMTFAWTLRHNGQLGGPRGTNILDSGAPYYDVYECADGVYISVGSMEPQFYDELLRVTGLDGDPLMAGQHDRSLWPEQKRRLNEAIRRRTSREWREAMENAQVCFAPVLDMAEAVRHPHNVARGTFVEVDGMTQPAPAPRFSRTTLDGPRGPRQGTDETRSILADAGCSTEEIESLLESGTAR
jgi:alpha-methylacyl-CoA racemase